MSGKLHNERVLTPGLLMLFTKTGRSFTEIAAEAGTCRRTVSNYMKKYGIAPDKETPKEIRLKELIDEAHKRADELQRLYFMIDKLKTEVEQEDAVVIALDAIAAEG